MMPAAVCVSSRLKKRAASQVFVSAISAEHVMDNVGQKNFRKMFRREKGKITD
ncbi:hypothetical protein LAD54_27750 [Klebsiella pneumoniae]|nr:hypothetical protein [Klebsiella pneumoniae]